jgi:hypothetical protein
MRSMNRGAFAIEGCSYTPSPVRIASRSRYDGSEAYEAGTTEHIVERIVRVSFSRWLVALLFELFES